MWKRTAQIVVAVIVLADVLFLLLAAVAGTLTHPVKAVGVLVFMFGLFGAVMFLKRLRRV